MRIGFCCKYITDVDQISGIKPTHDSYQYNVGTINVSSLKKMSNELAHQRIIDIAIKNLTSIKQLVQLIAGWPEHFRMLRLASDILPLYTHSDYSGIYAECNDMISDQFNQIGSIARQYNIRLSFHPGQFCVLASDSDIIVERSIREFEYHADMVRMMGYGRVFQDFKINIHVSGRRGIEAFKTNVQRLSPTALNCITVENDEYVNDINALLDVGLPVVFDIHHQWIKRGYFVEATDDIIKRVIDTWCGVRPVMHYSQSKEVLLQEQCSDTLPQLNQLLESGFKKSRLRAHSDFYWNTHINQLVKEYVSDFDIQCECKSKNLGRDRLYNEWFS